MAKQSFGMTIRAGRLGYRQVLGVGFVRIRSGGPPHRVDVAPFDHVPTDKGAIEHVAWWEGEDLVQLVRQIMRNHFRGGEVDRPTSVLLNDDGRVVMEE